MPITVNLAKQIINADNKIARLNSAFELVGKSEPVFDFHKAFGSNSFHTISTALGMTSEELNLQVKAWFLNFIDSTRTDTKNELNELMDPPECVGKSD